MLQNKGGFYKGFQNFPVNFETSEINVSVRLLFCFNFGLILRLHQKVYYCAGYTKIMINNNNNKPRLEKGLNSYKEGKATIREAAKITDLRYFEFFDLLAKENLIGTSPENTELMLKRMGY